MVLERAKLPSGGPKWIVERVILSVADWQNGAFFSMWGGGIGCSFWVGCAEVVTPETPYFTG